MLVSVTIDEYIGATLKSKQLTVQNKEEAYAALSQLNGTNISGALFSVNSIDLMIGGGNDTFVLSTWNEVKGVGSILRNQKNDSGSEIHIVSGGQSAAWDKASILSLDIVKQAVSHFVKTGLHNPGLIWIEHN